MSEVVWITVHRPEYTRMLLRRMKESVEDFKTVEILVDELLTTINIIADEYGITPGHVLTALKIIEMRILEQIFKQHPEIAKEILNQGREEE